MAPNSNSSGLAFCSIGVKTSIDPERRLPDIGAGADATSPQSV